MGEMNGIRSWARAPGRVDYDVVLSDFKWFGAWLADARLKEPIPQLRWALPLGLGALVFRLLAKQKIDRASLGIAAFLAGSIAFWFWGAPDPRFGVGFLASAGVLCVGFAAASVFSAQKLRLAAIPVLLAGVAVQTVRSAITENWRNQPAIPPQPQTFYVMTIDGPWGVPIRAPDPHDDQCWDTPLPCMPAQFLAPAYLARVRWRTIPTHGAASTAMAGSANAFTKLPLEVNAGGSGYSDSEGHAWQPDMGAQQGWAMSTTATISGTANPEVYQSARWSDTGRLSYQFTVPNGDYTVILKFAEFFYWTKGKREFDIALNGTTVASRFDIVAAGGGGNTATDVEYPLTVTNSQATVTLTGVTREPLINGIEILPASGPSGAEVKTHGSGAGVPQAK
jgi:hypothetical protein